MRQAAWPHVVSGPWSPDPDVNSRCDCSRPQTGVPDVVEVVHRALWDLPFPLPKKSVQARSLGRFREKVGVGGRSPRLQSALTAQLHLLRLSNFPYLKTLEKCLPQG